MAIDCVRYRYDEQRHKRFTTIEIIVEESNWSPPDPKIVGLRVEYKETELQRRVRQAGGKWNATKRLWEIHYDQAIALGLKHRIVRLEVSNIRHPKAPNIGH